STNAHHVRNFRYRASSVLTVETAAAVRRAEEHIEIAVAVVVEHRGAPTAARLVQTDLSRDILQRDGGLVPPGSHLHAMLGGHACRVAARFLGGKPDPQSHTLV